MKRRKLLSMLPLSALAASSFGQTLWPTAQPIRIVVPFTGGSGSDATARYYAEKLGPMLKQSIIVENRPGADGAIGIQYANSAPADGYTILQGSIGPMVVNTLMVKNMKYDPVRDFKPVFGYGRNMNAILVPQDSPFKSLKDLKVASAQRPLNVGVFSSTLKLVAQWFGDETGIKLTLIPYKGQGPVMTDVMAGQLDFGLIDLGGASTLVQQGKMRAIAVTGAERSPILPDVPTVKESGYPEFVQYSWNAFFVRSEVPDAVVRTLADAIRTVMISEETKKFYAVKGTEQIPLTASEMRALQIREIARYKKVALDNNIQPE